MADYDLADILGTTDDEMARQKAQALASALRGQKDLGLFGQIAGGRLADPGAALMQDAERQQTQLGRLPLERIQMALSRSRNAQEQMATERAANQLAEEKQQHDLMNGPNTPASQMARALASKYGRSSGFNVDPNSTAAQLLPFLPNAEKAYHDDVEAARWRAMMGGGAGAGGTGLPGLKPKDIQEQFKELAQSLSTVQGRGNLNKDQQSRLNSAERLEALILGPGGQIQNLTPQQVREAATALANLISSGSMSVSQIEELTPETSRGKFAQIKQKLFNEPTGADAQAFLQNMLETAAREKAVTLKQMRAGQVQSLPRFAGLRKVNQKTYDSLLTAAGLNPEDFDENGLPKTAPAAAAPQGGPAPAVTPARKTIRGKTYQKTAAGWEEVD